MLRLYTQNNCQFCEELKQKLTIWGFEYHVINISELSEHKTFLKEQGHKTVPQLYIDDFNINADIDTRAFTEEMFYDRLDVFISTKSMEDITELLNAYD